MPWKPAPAPSALSRTNGERSRGRSSPESKRRASQTPGRVGSVPQRSRWPMTPVTPANAATGGLTVCRSWPPSGRVPFTIRTRESIGRLTQMQDESITSVAARVSGSGCAKCAKPGANPARARADGSQGGRPPGDRAFHARAPHALHDTSPTRERGGWPWPAALARASGWCRGCCCRTGAGPALTALAAAPLGCADEGANGLPIQPEKTIGRLMQVQDEIKHFCRRSGSPARGAEIAQNQGADPPRPRKREPRRPRHPSFRRPWRSSSGPKPRSATTPCER